MSSPSPTVGGDTPHEVTSSASRLVAAAMDLAAGCACAGAPQIHVLRGFGRRSRVRAHEVRTQLRQYGDVAICDEAIPLATLEFRPVQHHVCVFIAASTPSGEAERIAALNEVPIVVPASAGVPNPISAVDEESSVLVATSDLRPETAVLAFPSASGRVANAAFDSYEIVPNQPEQGELSLYLGPGLGHLLATGSSVRIRSLPETSIVEVSGPNGRSSTWLAGTVEVLQRAGLHRIFRDGLSVADLPNTMTIHHQSRGLRRRRV